MNTINQLIQDCKDLLLPENLDNKTILEKALTFYKHFLEDKDLPDDYMDDIAYVLKELEE